jgi:hypothetical protein
VEAGLNIGCEKKCNWEAVMTTRSLCISAAVLLLAMTLTWPAFPGRSNTNRVASQSSGAGAGKVTFNPFSVTKKTDKSSLVFMRNGDEKLHGTDVKGHPKDNRP